MAYPLLKFVDAPAVGATVRLDLNPGTSAASGNGIVEEGFSFGAPELEGEPGATGRRWGSRRLTIPLEVVGNRATALAALAALSRELLRASNWLLFQPTASAKPIWFRTWMTQPGEISFENVRMAGTGDDSRTSRWEIEVLLDADPWAYGERVTQAAFTINNDPQASTNACRFTLPAITGDAPTPLRIRLTGDFRGDRSLLSVLPSAQNPSGQIQPIWTTNGTDTVSNADATASGGTTAQISFATNANLAFRMGFVGETARHGAYRMIARVRSSTSATVLVQIKPTTASPMVLAESTFAVTNSWNYVSLGTFDWPPGGRVEDDFLTTNSSNLALSLLASRIGGAGNLNVDMLVMIPVNIDEDDAETLIINHPTSSSTAAATYVDGDTRSVRLVSSGDLALPASTTGYQEGEFPHGVPGTTNVMRFFRTMTLDSGGDDLTASTSITVSYMPRWLYLADA